MVAGRLAGVALLLVWDVFCVVVLWREINVEGPFVEELFSEAERSPYEEVLGVVHPMLEFLAYMLAGFIGTDYYAVVDPRRERNLAYVVTDQRVLTLGGFWRPEIERSIPMEVLRPDRVVLGRDGSGRGTITFRDHAWTDDHGKHAASLEQPPDAPAVHALILRTMGRSGAPGPSRSRNQPATRTPTRLAPR